MPNCVFSWVSTVAALVEPDETISWLTKWTDVKPIAKQKHILVSQASSCSLPGVEVSG
jgi:hypothetical protein